MPPEILAFVPLSRFQRKRGCIHSGLSPHVITLRILGFLGRVSGRGGVSERKRDHITACSTLEPAGQPGNVAPKLREKQMNKEISQTPVHVTSLTNDTAPPAT